MRLEDLIEALLPGYMSLPQHRRDKFLQSKTGKYIQGIYDKQVAPSSVWFLTRMYEQNLCTVQSQERYYQTRLNAVVRDPDIQKKLRESVVFRTLRVGIICQQAYTVDYPWLQAPDLFKNIDEFEHQFHNFLKDEKNLVVHRNDSDVLWGDTIQNYIFDWQKGLFTADRQKMLLAIKQRIEDLASKMPSYIREKITSSHEQQFMDLYLHHGTVRQQWLPEGERKILQDIVLDFLNEQTEPYQHMVDRDFNQAPSLVWAQRLLSAEKIISPDMMDDLIKRYTSELARRISKGYLLTITHTNESTKVLWSISKRKTGVELSFTNNQRASEVLAEELCSLPKGSFLGKLINNSQAIFTNWSDTYFLMRATGFAAQSGSTADTLLDWFNRFRYAQELSDTKSILTDLLVPVYPIYIEYRALAQDKDGNFVKYCRTLLPMVLIAGVVVSTFGLLASFALPEVAALFVMVPVLYVAAVVTAQYLELRDFLYKMTTEWWFGGPYKVPYYQVNSRMLDTKAFGSRDLAQAVADYYIKAHQACDLQEQIYAQQYSKAGLGEIDAVARAENNKRKNHLIASWVDIHENRDFALDHLPMIAQRQIHADIRRLYEQLQTTVTEVIAPALDQELCILAERLNKELATPSPIAMAWFPPLAGEQEKSLPLPIEDVSLSVVPVATRPKPALASLGFFKQHTNLFEPIKAQLVQLVELEQQLFTATSVRNAPVHGHRLPQTDIVCDDYVVQQEEQKSMR